MLEVLELYLFHPLRLLGEYQREYNKDWDKLLNKWIAECDNFDVGEHTITFHLNAKESHEVWIENKWYAYAHQHLRNTVCKDQRLEFRPKVTTMHRLHNLIMEYNEEQKNKVRSEGIKRMKELLGEDN